MIRSVSCFLALVALAVGGGACSSYRLPEGEMVQEADAWQMADEALGGLWPPAFRLVHRVEVRVAGRQMHLLGYLAAVRGQGLRAVAMGEMGGKFLDILATDTVRILHKPTRLPERPILEGVGADLSLAFDSRPTSGRVAVRGPSGDRLTVVDMRGDETVETVVSVSQRRVAEVRRYRGGRLLCTVAFEDWRAPGEGIAAVPYRVRFSNRRWHYEMTAELTRWRGVDVEPKVLRPEDWGE